MFATTCFSEVFRLIRKHVPKKKRHKTALPYWERAMRLKVKPAEMCCDRTLIKLGLAKEIVDRHGEEQVIYYGDPNTLAEWALGEDMERKR
jgi:hypothetical protein